MASNGKKVIKGPLTIILLVPVLTILLAACRITYIVRLNGTDLYGTLQTPCGYAKVCLRGKGKRYFTFSQVFRLKARVRYYADSIQVLVNHRLMLSETMNVTRQTGEGKRVFDVYDKDTVATRFFIEEGVFEEDTILIKTRGLLDCMDDSSATDRFYYYFNRNELIRIQ